MEAGTFDQRPDVMAERLGVARTEIRDLKDWRSRSERKQDRQEDQITDLVKAVETLVTGFEGVRTMLVRFALSVALSAIVSLFTVLIATGKI